MASGGAHGRRRQFLAGLSTLPLETHEAGDLILRKGQAAGKVFILKQGAVEVIDGDDRIGFSDEPGTVFGEIGVLLDQPPMADVRVLQPSTFYARPARFFFASIATRRCTSRNCSQDA